MSAMARVDTMLILGAKSPAIQLNGGACQPGPDGDVMVTLHACMIQPQQRTF